MYRTFISVISLLVVIIISGCAARFEQPARYMMNLHVISDLEGATEIKDQKFNICFKDNYNTPMCLNNLKSGSLADIRTNSPTIELASIDLLGTEKYEYSFIKNTGPKITLKNYVPNVYMGSLLILVEHKKDKPVPSVSLFCDCIEKVKQQMINSLTKFNMLKPEEMVSTECMKIGFALPPSKTRKQPYSIMLVVPKKE